MPFCWIFWKKNSALFLFNTDGSYQRKSWIFFQWKVFNYWWGLITEGQFSLPVKSWFSHCGLNVSNTAPAPLVYQLLVSSCSWCFVIMLCISVLSIAMSSFIYYIFVSSFLFSHPGKVKFVMFFLWRTTFSLIDLSLSFSSLDSSCFYSDSVFLC